jgi:hypothetical protein
MELLDLISEYQHDVPFSLNAKDPDFDLPQQFELSVRKVFNVQHLDFSTFMPETRWIIPHGVADFVCQSCIKESLRKFERITFRKSWRYVCAPVCPIHREILTDFGHRKPDLFRLLIPSNTSHRTHLSQNSLTLISKAALIGQSMMLKMEGYLTTKKLAIEPACKISETYKAYKLLLELLLHSASQGGGLATQFITSPRPKDPASKRLGMATLMLLGALESSALERACALTMLSIITGELAPRQIKTLNREVQPRFFFENKWDPFSLGSYCRLIYDSHRWHTESRVSSALKALSHPQSMQFLKGFGV